MRQEPIYITNTHNAIKNRAIYNFNTSSDFCTFSYPVYVINNTGLISTGLTINDILVNFVNKNVNTLELPFVFTDNYESITGDTATFNLDIYKYNNILTRFNEIPLISLSDITSNQLSNGTGYTINLDLTKLQPDGEYMIKTSFNHEICTYILSRLGLINTTSDVNSNLQYGNYNENTDAYFIILTNPEKPVLTIDTSTQLQSGTLYSELTIIEQEQQTVVISDTFTGMPIVVLNGLILTVTEDYTITNGVISFNDTMYNGDMVNVIYTFASDGNGINSETVTVGGVVSGVTNGEGFNSIYFNIDTNKFELFVKNAISDINSMIITLNGVTLSNGVDFYQSTSNPKKIILNGEVISGDIMNIFYLGFNNFSGGISSSNMTLFWEIPNALNKENGEFDVQISTNIGFTSIISETTIPYESFESSFSSDIYLPGSFGDVYYVRVINRKTFTTIKNEILTKEINSDILTLKLTTNTNNSY